MEEPLKQNNKSIFYLSRSIIKVHIHIIVHVIILFTTKILRIFLSFYWGQM